MKEAITVYVPTSGLTHFKVTCATDNEGNSMSTDVRKKELITFTPDEWIEQEKAVELFQQTIDNQTNIIIEKDDEITRLKGLIEDQFLKGLRGWGNPDQRQQVLQEFKIENKL